jgi:hypothetical protein
MAELAFSNNYMSMIDCQVASSIDAPNGYDSISKNYVVEGSHSRGTAEKLEKLCYFFGVGSAMSGRHPENVLSLG